MLVPEREGGVTVVVLRKFQTQVLPKLSAIRDKVDKGGLMNGSEADFLRKLLERLAQEKLGVDVHPGWQEFFARLVGLCHEIAVKGLENARKVEAGEG